MDDLADGSVTQFWKRTCEDNPVGENSSFIFTVSAKSVQLYHFKLAYIVLHMAVKEFFESHFQKWRNRSFYLQSQF